MVKNMCFADIKLFCSVKRSNPEVAIRRANSTMCNLAQTIRIIAHHT